MLVVDPISTVAVMEIKLRQRCGEIAVYAEGLVILSLNPNGVDRWLGTYELEKNGIQIKNGRIKEELT